MATLVEQNPQPHPSIDTGFSDPVEQWTMLREYVMDSTVLCDELYDGIPEMFNHCISWYEANKPSSPKPTQNEFKYYLTDMLKRRIDGDNVFGIALKEDTYFEDVVLGSQIPEKQ